jgi:aryl-alcohol dehydrogenase-like predicted oxidoreductase
MRKNGEGTRINRKQVIEAVDNQLRRLKTDYIDVLSFNWPDRYVPLYGVRTYFQDRERKDSTTVREQLEIVQELVKAGKVRHFALSNESPYGVGAFTSTSETLDLPRPCLLQNCYNLLSRYEFEGGLLEACSPVNGDLGLMAFSPLAGGALTGKYLNPNEPQLESRLHKFIGYMTRYIADPSKEATLAYKRIADKYDIELQAFALNWVYTRPFVTSTIIGATNAEQLHYNVLALNLGLEGEIIDEINEVYEKHLDPARGIFPLIDPRENYVDPASLPWGSKEDDFDLDELGIQETDGDEDAEEEVDPEEKVAALLERRNQKVAQDEEEEEEDTEEAYE